MVECEKLVELRKLVARKRLLGQLQSGRFDAGGGGRTLDAPGRRTGQDRSPRDGEQRGVVRRADCAVGAAADDAAGPAACGLNTGQRTERGPNEFIGWGVVDPVKAVTKAPENPPSEAAPDAPVQLASAPIVPAPVGIGETQADRDGRTATYVVGAGALLVALLIGGGVVLRDHRRKSAD